MEGFWIIIILLLVVNFFAMNGRKTNTQYKNWYRPWLLVIMTLICLAYYKKLTGGFEPNTQYDKFMIEFTFIIVVISFWLGLKFILHTSKINDKLYPLLKKFNMNRVRERKYGYANFLVWPYVYDNHKIRFRYGYKFFKYLFWIAIILIFLSCFFSSKYFDRFIIFQPTVLSFLAVPVFLEWLVYFGKKPDENERPDYYDDEGYSNTSFYDLYSRYKNEENGFYESWISGQFRSNPDEEKNVHKKDEEYLNEYIEKVKNENTDLIIGSDNFTDLVPEVADLIINTIEKGGNILMISDIADHSDYNPSSVGIKTEKDESLSIVQLFSIYIKQILTYKVPAAESLAEIGYYSDTDSSGLTKRILICSAEDALSKELIHSDWMKEMDLMMVFQFNDSLANNLGIKRQLSLWLKQQNKSFKSLFFKNYSAGGDEAISVTWIVGRDVPEVKLPNVQTSVSSYFINFAYEYSVSNLNKILVGNVNEFDLAPGMELSVFPIMENIDHIHYFEGFNLDFVQSKNKLEGLQKSFRKGNGSAEDPLNYLDNVSQSKLLKGIQVNNLPFIVHPRGNSHCTDRHVSIVYDSINNAPKLYQKYMHLGEDESFVCIVSKPHLMREYFAENINYFVASTIEPLELQLSKSKINLCLELLKLLINEQIDLEFIKSLINMHSIDPGSDSIVEFIKKLYKQYLFLDVSKNAVLKSESKTVFRDGEYYHLHCLSMDKQKLEVNEIFEYLRKIKVKDSSGNLILDIPKYLLFQNFLPQQNIIIDGISYEYIQYSDINKELVLRTQPTDNFSFNKSRAVIEISKNAKIENVEPEDNAGIFINGRLHHFTSEINETEIEIYYDCYYRFNRFYNSPLSEKQTPKLIDLTKFEGLIEDSKRKYNTRFLHYKWELPEKFVSHKAELTTRIHHLIYEFLPILFPQRCQYVMIASDNNLDTGHRKTVPWIFPENNFEYSTGNFIEFYIVEDSFADLGILKPIQNFFTKKILTDLYSYLKWINNSNKKDTVSFSQTDNNPKFLNDKASFLRYGLNENQIKWNFDLLIDFLGDSKLIDTSINLEIPKLIPTDLNKHLKIELDEDQPDTETNVTQTVQSSVKMVECDYCAKPYKLFEVEVMEDGLHRCINCQSNTVNDLEAGKIWIEYILNSFKLVYGIAFELEFNLNVVSATELHHALGRKFKITDKYDLRERSGLKNNIIYIEKGLKYEVFVGCAARELSRLYMLKHMDYQKMSHMNPLVFKGLPVFSEYMLLKEMGDNHIKAFASELRTVLTNLKTAEGTAFRHMEKHYNSKRFMKNLTLKYPLAK